MAAQTAERRPLGALGRMSVVAAIHVAAFVVILRGLDIVPQIKLFDPMITRIVDEPIPPPPDPKIREPLESETTFALPKPDELPPQEAEKKEAIDAEFVPAKEIKGTGGSAMVEPQILGARPDPRRPLSQPIYPAQLIRENAEGFVDVEVFVQPDGRVGDARIVKTSGYEAFDRNTLDEAKRRWRLVPATRDGVAVPQWYRLRVVFKLKNQ